MSNASELLSKSSYCRNSKHAKCKTPECGCKCHADLDTLTDAEVAGIAAAALAAAEAVEKPSNVFDGVDLNDEAAVDNVIADVAVAAANKAIADRLAPAKAPAPAPAKKAKAPKEPKPVVVGTIDGKLSNAHKRAIRTQMVAYLNAMPVELSGDLEGVTPEEAAGYVDTYWVKYIDPARDKARHTK